MRQSFDLLTKIGWQNWWQHKWSWWSYRHIPHDTSKHLVCVLKGHIDLPNWIGGETYCQRCHMRLEGKR